MTVQTKQLIRKKLSFHNLSIGGGFEAIHTDTNKIYDSHICYVNKIECYAYEARFGGIVIEKKQIVENNEELPIEEIENTDLDEAIKNAWEIINKTKSK